MGEVVGSVDMCHYTSIPRGTLTESQHRATEDQAAADRGSDKMQDESVITGLKTSPRFGEPGREFTRLTICKSFRIL